MSHTIDVDARKMASEKNMTSPKVRKGRDVARAIPLRVVIIEFLVMIGFGIPNAMPDGYAQTFPPPAPPQQQQQQQLQLSSPATVIPNTSPNSVSSTALPPTASPVPPPTLYPPGITTYPGNMYNPSATFFPYQTGTPIATTPIPPPPQALTLPPPPYTTFPSSVFPPTTSFATSTAIAPVTGPLSPWFPSIPALSCGGTFTMTVVGSMDTDAMNSNENEDGKKSYAFQIQSNGGSALDTESIEGQVFAGENNIERNNGNDFDIKDVFNDCHVVTYSQK